MNHNQTSSERFGIAEERDGHCTSIVVRDKYKRREEKLEEGLQKLNGLIGLTEVKKLINEFVCTQELENFLKVMRIIEKNNRDEPSYHMAFLGKPGTGKTETARCMSSIFYGLGITESDQFFEVNRSELVGKFIGETESKTKAVIEEAINQGGVLFIDEFHQLAADDSSRDFGKKALNVLVSYLENQRNYFVCIVAGYPEEMQMAIATDPGLKSRFSTFVKFDDYTTEEMIMIYSSFVQRNSHLIYQIDNERKKLALPQKEANEEVRNLLSTEIQKLSALYPDFGNGRAMRKLYELTKRAHNARLHDKYIKKKRKFLSRNEIAIDYVLFSYDDILSGLTELGKEMKVVSEQSSKKIGFLS